MKRHNGELVNPRPLAALPPGFGCSLTTKDGLRVDNGHTSVAQRPVAGVQARTPVVGPLPARRPSRGPVGLLPMRLLGHERGWFALDWWGGRSNDDWCRPRLDPGGHEFLGRSPRAELGDQDRGEKA